MGQMEKVQVIQEQQLDQGQYFQSLFLEACRANLLSDMVIERIQLELVELMSKEVVRYTNDESSSIPVEKAQELLQSITYCIGYFLKRTIDMTQKLDMLRTETIESLFYKGMDEVSACKDAAQKLFKAIKTKAMSLNNIAYQDTIHEGIAPFFHDYNIEFGAHEAPRSIDYPLFQPIVDLTGVEYIYEYLRKLNIEQDFLMRFSEKTINRLLKQFDTEAEHMLINIFELVLINYLGCSLLGKNEVELEIHQEELGLLQSYMEPLTVSEITAKIEALLREKQEELKLKNDALSYLLAGIPQIAVRIKHNLKTGTLDKIWIIRKETVLKETFVDGISMDDKKLRLMIEKLSDIRITSQKIAIIKDNVRSQADLIELLDACFYEEEFEEVFASFSDTTKEILKKGILIREGQRRIDEYEPQKEWEKLLFLK